MSNSVHNEKKLMHIEHMDEYCVIKICICVEHELYTFECIPKLGTKTYKQLYSFDANVGNTRLSDMGTALVIHEKPTNICITDHNVQVEWKHSGGRHIIINIKIDQEVTIKISELEALRTRNLQLEEQLAAIKKIIG